MVATSTGLQVVEELIKNRGIGEVIKNGQATIAATALTSVYYFGNSSGEITTGSLRNKGAGFWRPSNATGLADDWRLCGDVNGATGAVTVATWSDTTLGTEDIYLLYYCHPQYVIDAMNKALRAVYFTTDEPLSTKPTGTTLADAGFQNSATTYWTESDADGGAATTFTKVSTSDSENVYSGRIRGGRVENAAAGGYIRQRFAVTEGEQVISFALTRLDSGTNFEHVLRDTNNSAFIGTTVEHDQEQWQFTRRVESVPTDCKILEVRLQGEGTTDDFYIAGHWFYRTRNQRLILDTTWDTEFKVPSLAYAEFTGHSSGSNVYDGMSFQLTEVPSGDYSFLSNRPGASPYAIQFHTDHWFQYPLYIQGRRAHSDVDGPFTRVLTETTSCDLDLFEAAVAVEFFSDPRVRIPDRIAHLSRAQQDFAELGKQFRVEGPARRKGDWAYASMPN